MFLLTILALVTFIHAFDETDVVSSSFEFKFEHFHHIIVLSFRTFFWKAMVTFQNLISILQIYYQKRKLGWR